MGKARTRRLQRNREARRRRANRMRILGITGLVVVGGTVLVGAITIDSVAANLREKQASVKEIRLGQNTRIYDRDGKLLGTIAGTTNRTQVRSERIPQILKDATVAIEDKRFYDHDGVDYYRLAGSAVRNVGGGRQGGSTITMQLARNLLPGGANASRTVERKLEEAYLALQYEKKFTKDEILTKYLNGVFYGNNAVGVQAASLTYFDRDVAKLTLPQAALLAGLPQAPSAYSPFGNQEAARTRRNLVLEQMAEQGYISRDEAERAKKAGLQLKRGDTYKAPKREGYFFEYVRQRLIDSFGEREVEKGGFRVNSTVDPQLQTDAKNAISENLGLSDDPEAAIVMIDSQKGYIRAMQSSQEYAANKQFNYATQAKRQPGSTFKTFVLTRFVEEGYNPYTTSYVSKPLKFTDPVWGPINVATYSDTYGGRMSVSSATLRSDNSVYTQMTLDVDPRKVVDTAYSMGIPRARDLPRVPSVGLGSGEVTPLDMATAYSALSNGGYRIQPQGVQSIILPTGQRRPIKITRRRAFSDGVAYEVTKILRANVSGGTGTAANIASYVAGKTGTTDNYVDAWFVGYTPCYTTAVWVGYPNDTGVKRSMYSVHGITVAGGTFPARIWATFMRKVLENPRYKCDLADFPLPKEPVSWQPFSSEFTRAPDPVTSVASEPDTTTEGTTTKAAPPPEPQEPIQPSQPPEPTPSPVPTPTPEPVPTPEPTPVPEPTPTPPPAPTTPATTTP